MRSTTRCAATRRTFDVSHTCVAMRGARVREYLRHLLARSPSSWCPARRSTRARARRRDRRPDRLFPERAAVRMVVNAGTRDKDIELGGRTPATTACRSSRPRHDRRAGAECPLEGGDADPAFRAARARTRQLLLRRRRGQSLASWRAPATWRTASRSWLPATEAAGFWTRLRRPASPRRPRRPRQRLEGWLHGSDMDESTSPLESGLGWTIAWEPRERDFIGRAALAEQKARGVPRKLVGLACRPLGAPRSHQKPSCGGGRGRGDE